MFRIECCARLKQESFCLSSPPSLFCHPCQRQSSSCHWHIRCHWNSAAASRVRLCFWRIGESAKMREKKETGWRKLRLFWYSISILYIICKSNQKKRKMCWSRVHSTANVWSTTAKATTTKQFNQIKCHWRRQRKSEWMNKIKMRKFEKAKRNSSQFCYPRQHDNWSGVKLTQAREENVCSQSENSEQKKAQKIMKIASLNWK